MPPMGGYIDFFLVFLNISSIVYNKTFYKFVANIIIKLYKKIADTITKKRQFVSKQLNGFIFNDVITATGHNRKQLNDFYLN